MSAARSAGRRRLGALSASLATVVALATRAATGLPPAEPGAYRVEPECPSRAAWRATLRERLPPLLWTHPLLESLSVSVGKLRHEGRVEYEGALGPLDGAPETARSVRGASCEEVLDALGFIGALGLERASRVTLPASAPAEPKASAGDPRLDPGTAAPVAPAATQLGAAAFALLQAGLVPGSELSLGAALELRFRLPGLQPWAQLGVYFSVPEETRTSAGSIRYEHWSARGVACPLRVPASGAFALRPCVELDVGRTTGEGLSVAGATRRSAPWVSTGAQLRAAVVLGERLELGLGVAGVVPLWHSRFYLRPDLTSFETPLLGYRAESHASVMF